MSWCCSAGASPKVATLVLRPRYAALVLRAQGTLHLRYASRLRGYAAHLRFAQGTLCARYIHLRCLLLASAPPPHRPSCSSRGFATCLPRGRATSVSQVRRPWRLSSFARSSTSSSCSAQVHLCTSADASAFGVFDPRWVGCAIPNPWCALSHNPCSLKHSNIRARTWAGIEGILALLDPQMAYIRVSGTLYVPLLQCFTTGTVVTL